MTHRRAEPGRIGSAPGWRSRCSSSTRWPRCGPSTPWSTSIRPASPPAAHRHPLPPRRLPALGRGHGAGAVEDAVRPCRRIRPRTGGDAGPRPHLGLALQPADASTTASIPPAAEMEWTVLEVSNTPWHERCSYVVGPPGEHRFAKAMHVSPFLPARGRPTPCATPPQRSGSGSASTSTHRRLLRRIVGSTSRAPTGLRPNWPPPWCCDDGRSIALALAGICCGATPS